MGKDFSSWLCYPRSDYAAKAAKNKQLCGQVQGTPSQHLPAQNWLFPILITATAKSLFYLTSLMQFVGLLCKSDIMHICVLCGSVGVYKITYFSSNKVFCYRKRQKWS